MEQTTLPHFENKPIDDSNSDTIERKVEWSNVTYQERQAATISHAMALDTRVETMRRIFDITNPTVIFVTKMTRGNINQLLQCRIAPESLDVFKIAHQAYGKE